MQMARAFNTTERAIRLGLSIFVAAVAVLLATASGVACAATAANAQSSLGINLNVMNYYTPEQPFLNIFRTSGITKANPTGWYTRASSMAETNEESRLTLDAHGDPTALKVA